MTANTIMTAASTPLSPTPRKRRGGMITSLSDRSLLHSSPQQMLRKNAMMGGSSDDGFSSPASPLCEATRSKSCIVLNVSSHGKQRGNLTFSTSVNRLQRSGSSRKVMGDCCPPLPSRSNCDDSSPDTSSRSSCNSVCTSNNDDYNSETEEFSVGN